MDQIKKRAFTLAETLIVLGIIGIVAMLTIPSLSTDASNKDKVVKLKKAYSVLEDAYGRMTSNYGLMDNWADIDTETITKRMASSMKITKNCGMEEDDSCFESSAKIEGIESDKNVKSKDVGKFVTGDNISYAFLIEQSDGSDCNKDITGEESSMPASLKTICGVVMVDVTGAGKSRSVQGKDLFEFYITKEGIYPVGTENDDLFQWTTDCLDTAGGSACTAWAIYNGNLDYSKVDSSGKCSDGKALEWSTPKGTYCD